MPIRLRTAVIAFLSPVLLCSCSILTHLIPAAPNTGDSKVVTITADDHQSTVVFYPAQNPIWSNLKVGKMTCNAGKSFMINRAESGSNLDINWQGSNYTLHRIYTSTGAYRYEDKRSGLVLIQIPAKIQLLNSKMGQRLADECHPI